VQGGEIIPLQQVYDGGGEIAFSGKFRWQHSSWNKTGAAVGFTVKTAFRVRLQPVLSDNQGRLV